MILCSPEHDIVKQRQSQPSWPALVCFTCQLRTLLICGHPAVLAGTLVYLTRCNQARWARVILANQYRFMIISTSTIFKKNSDTLHVINIPSAMVPAKTSLWKVLICDMLSQIWIESNQFLKLMTDKAYGSNMHFLPQISNQRGGSWPMAYIQNFSNENVPILENIRLKIDLGDAIVN